MKERRSNGVSAVQAFLACLILLPSLPAGTYARDSEAVDDSGVVVEKIRRVVDEVRAASYPELQDATIDIKPFDSPSDYFRTRFTFGSFLFGKKLRYVLRVNRNLLDHGAPDDAVRAIVAHELAHLAYFESQKRLQLLGLARLASGDFTAKFERSTDVRAIANGYADGLKRYRVWLYGHMSPKKLEEKKRNYFSPEEIDAVSVRLRDTPELLPQWLKAPPRSLQEIEGAAR